MAAKEVSKRNLARQYYVELGIKSLKRLSLLVEISERTLIRWKDAEKWDELRNTRSASPAEIAKVYRRQIILLMDAIEEKQHEAEKDSDAYITAAQMKVLAFYRRELTEIEEHYNLASMMLYFINALLDFIVSVPAEELKDKAAMIDDLQNMLPRFMALFTNDQAA